MPSLWLVDGSHAIFRAYHALPHLSVHSGPLAGTSTHAVLGFTNMLLRAIREGEPTHLAVAFDEEAKAKRIEIFSEYKATRGPPPDDIIPQFALIRQMLEALRVPAIGFPGYEADDVIATLARRARTQGFEVVIVSGDKDLMQLVEPSGQGTRCYDSMYEKWYGPAEVEAKWGVGPELIGDLLALTGDKIDNIPGVPGVGEKTAAGLLKEYGNLDGVLAHAAEIKKPKLRENLINNIDKVRIGRKLISLYEDLPLAVELSSLERKLIDEPRTRKLFTDLEFVRLLKDLPRPPPTPPTGARSIARDVASVQALHARAKAAGRVGLFVLTSELPPAPLRDELLGIGISLPDESVYVPLSSGGPAQQGLLDAQSTEAASLAFAFGSSPSPAKPAPPFSASAFGSGPSPAKPAPPFSASAFGSGPSPAKPAPPFSASAFGSSPSPAQPAPPFSASAFGSSPSPAKPAPPFSASAFGSSPSPAKPAPPFSASAFLAALAPLLSDVSIAKDGADLKGALVALRRAGADLQGLGLDVRLASYLLDPTARDHSLNVSARERISCELPDLKEICERSGKGKKSTPLSQLPLDEVGPTVAALAEGARRLADQLLSDLSEEPELWKLYQELELPLSTVLAEMELIGITLDVQRLARIDELMSQKIDQLLKEIHQLAGQEFSPASNLQLAEVLYNKLGLPVIKRGKTGPSTDQEVLEELAAQHPIAAKILEHRQLSKLKGTYLEALPAALGADKRLHTTFDQAVAATGRLSSINPNLQNIPIRRAEGAQIREAFVPRQGWRLVSADYSQIELRILAHVSGDAVLRESFRTGEDLHARTAAETFGVLPLQVTREQRSIAKMINYGIAYGLSSFGLAQRLSLPLDEASSIIERYFARYQGVKAWLDATIDEARKTGMVKTLLGRRRFLPDIASRNMVARNAAERTAVNTPIQGTAADLMKRAMLLVQRSLEMGGHKARMLLQVHDELVLESPPDEVDALRALVKEGMSGAADLAVRLVVDVGEGETWAAAH